MMVSARAQDLEDTLSNVDASPKELVEGGSKTRRGKVELEKTFEFGPSLITQMDLKEYVKFGWFNEGQARPSGGESMRRSSSVKRWSSMISLFVAGLHLSS